MYSMKRKPINKTSFSVSQTNETQTYSILFVLTQIYND